MQVGQRRPFRIPNESDLMLVDADAESLPRRVQRALPASRCNRLGEGHSRPTVPRGAQGRRDPGRDTPGAG